MNEFIKLLGAVGDLSQVLGEAVVTDPAEIDPVLERVSDVDDEGALNQLKAGIEAASYLPRALVHYNSSE